MSKIKSISKSTFTAVNESLHSTDYVAPTYISTFLNNVNGYAHSTRKETVGDLATIIFPEYLAQASNPSPADWKDYYLHNYQEKYDAAIIKLLSKFEEVKRAVNNVTEQEIKAWLEDFMFYKTFNGLYVQDAISSSPVFLNLIVCIAITNDLVNGIMMRHHKVVVSRQ